MPTPNTCQATTPQLSTQSANAFVNLVQSGGITLYLFLGKISPWADEESPDDESYNPTAIRQLWDDIYVLKKVNPANVSLVAPRTTWEMDTAYDQYDDDDDDLYTNRTFYVCITDDLDPDRNYIYKCINNNGGEPSTVEPYTDVPGVFGTQYVEGDEDNDGYEWIFIGQFDANQLDKFLTDDYFPVALATADDDNLQWDAMTSAIAGGIHRVVVTAGGSGYTDGTHRLVVVSPDSTGEGLVVDVTVGGGVVTDATVLSPGAGYRDCVLEMPTTAGDGLGATFRPVFSPHGGHGANIINEIVPNAVCVNAIVGGSEEGVFGVTNDFRQYGLVINPRIAADGGVTIASADTYTMDTALSLTNIENNSHTPPEFFHDEWVYAGGSGIDDCVAKGRVCHFVDGDTPLSLINVRGTFSVGDTIRGVTSETTATISSITRTPTIVPGSGEVLYYVNRVAVERHENQKEEFKLILKY